jgi:hypothetical protein
MDAYGSYNPVRHACHTAGCNNGDGYVINAVPIILGKDLLFGAEYLTAEGMITCVFPRCTGKAHDIFRRDERAVFHTFE